MKNILFIANGSKGWMGGVYYIKNIIYSITESKKLNAYILVDKDSYEIFKKYEDGYSNVKLIYKNHSSISMGINKCISKLSRTLIKRDLDFFMLNYIKKYNIDYIYPINRDSLLGHKNKYVCWIPDFQHKYLPKLFTEKEIKNREKNCLDISKTNSKLILSSKSAYNDFVKFYDTDLTQKFVCHFTSDIEELLPSINESENIKIRNKYNINEDYVIICNQFWQHKNHITAFKAINELKDTGIQLICTGSKEDYRNKYYFHTLEKFISKNNLESNIKILGLIPRKEQINLLAYANLVIQPSLFEGWNTSVEEAKELEKKILLSDINTHIEQADKNCILFNKTDYKELAKLITKNFKNENKNFIFNSLKIENIKKEYSQELEKVFI